MGFEKYVDTNSNSARYIQIQIYLSRYGNNRRSDSISYVNCHQTKIFNVSHLRPAQLKAPHYLIGRELLRDFLIGRELLRDCLIGREPARRLRVLPVCGDALYDPHGVCHAGPCVRPMRTPE